ncbi:hypothetical protein PILCRDRAFT_829741 [Piloderma croceum F 1598]|uniref:Uncharacterized protein n=1 Tax=Piloderma croceum (strain F 1598) TaxID=765440 RepID=A0A0C3EXD0_PILCF|nr:hypothetical protein PILCRDRAFT_829741 [Piloderma croceum F 1598]
MSNKPHTEFTEVPSICFMGSAGRYFLRVASEKYLDARCYPKLYMQAQSEINGLDDFQFLPLIYIHTD